MARILRRFVRPDERRSMTGTHSRSPIRGGNAMESRAWEGRSNKFQSERRRQAPQKRHELLRSESIKSRCRYLPPPEISRAVPQYGDRRSPPSDLVVEPAWKRPPAFGRAPRRS